MDTSEYCYKRKVVSVAEVSDIVGKLRKRNKKVVFTNGCFDVLHRGHIQYLRESRKLGDVLVIGLNSDCSVKRLKGDSRPINKEEDRAFLLEALDFVDYVVIFDDNTPLQLIDKLKPDYYTKSGDYSFENIIGSGLGGDIVEQYGGRVVIIEFVDGYSTSAIISK